MDDDFEQFAAESCPALLRYAYLLCRDSARAEDLVQDALVKMLRRCRSGDVVTHPRAYARRVVTNEYLSWRRLKSSGEIGLVDERGIADGTDAQAERDLMWRVLGTLPPRARAVLVLRYYEELPDRDIAAVLGCAEATVRSIAARAFATLRSEPQLARSISEDA